MKVVSFFAGCGGLDLGFSQAGFCVVWANEYDNTIQPTYRLNHPNTALNTSDIRELTEESIPDCDGFIGGPPCQSWSLGGSMRGLQDNRGKLFLDYIRLIKAKRPKFFVIENVAGIISDKHFKTFQGFLNNLTEAGYNVRFSVMNAADYGVPQDRIRVFVVGIRDDLSITYRFPDPITPNDNHITLKQAIGDIKEQPKFYNKETVKKEYDLLWNHDCYSGPYDKKYMARNRIRKWNEVSFTIQAQGRNAPLHPQSPPMIFVTPEERQFDKHQLDLYRRLSVRECARIQTFPDSFHFLYNNVLDGYKMVGNAVPPRLAKHLALALHEQIVGLYKATRKNDSCKVLVGYYRNEKQLRLTMVNKLYYVRTGFRPGAMQMPSVMDYPNYLLLHKGNNMQLFRLKKSMPFLMSREELERIGFTPHGDVYLCFQIEDNRNLNEIPLCENEIQKIQRSTNPYMMKCDNCDI
jgi:DNA (cytosine-5)-methyltransferase 1